MDDVKKIFDGYDTGIRYADDAIGRIINHLDELGVLDETAILLSSDHGEGFGELGVYSDHQAADEATSHIPALLSWPGIEPRVDSGLHYHLDLAATVVELSGGALPTDVWDGQSLATSLRKGVDDGRDHLVITQGEWTCQRGVRFGNHMYLSTMHDGFHCWPDEMLFDIVEDPHETNDLAAGGQDTDLVEQGRGLLSDWLEEQLGEHPDPMLRVIDEGGPYHTRGHLPEYLERLEATGRGEWVPILRERHPAESDQEYWAGHKRSWRRLIADMLGAPMSVT